MSEKKPRRRSRPLRCEEPERLFFVTTRTLEEVFWLHPLLCSQMKPVNREARRVVDAKRARLRKKLERVVAAANQQHERFHHFCPEAGNNGEVRGAMRRHVGEEAAPPFPSPAL